MSPRILSQALDSTGKDGISQCDGAILRTNEDKKGVF